MFTKEQRKLLFLSSLGGILEFYDFIIYAVLVGYIAQAFFITGNKLTSLMATFATFSIGYLVRPLGGIICGHFGDRFGRKKVFTLSILVMAIATFAIGLVPSYQTWGIFAPLLLTGLRILQGLSVGGEIPGAVVYVSEAMPNRKSFACGIILAALISGITLGLLTEAILSTLLSHEQMLVWGWRLPFFIGGAFGICGFFLRKNLEESRLFQEIESDIEAFPLAKVFQKRSVNAISGVFIVSSGAALITGLFLFTPSYVSNILKVHSAAFLWLNPLAMLVVSLLCIVVGFLADHVNKKMLFLILSVVAVVVAYPIFYIYSQQFAWVGLALLLSALLTGIAWGVIPSMLTELFPTTIRYSGVAIAYNLGFAIFGGLTPLISTTLIYETGSNAAPAFYLIGIFVLATLAIRFTQHQPLQDEKITTFLHKYRTETPSPLVGEGARRADEG